MLAYLPQLVKRHDVPRNGRPGSRMGKFALPKITPGQSFPRKRESPARHGLNWTPAYAGVTTSAIFIFLGEPQAHGHSECNSRIIPATC